MSFAQQVDDLLAVTGELTEDDELIEATRDLRDLAAEHDDVDRRFQAAAARVQGILLDRLGRSRP